MLPEAGSHPCHPQSYQTTDFCRQVHDPEEIQPHSHPVAASDQPADEVGERNGRKEQGSQGEHEDQATGEGGDGPDSPAQ